MTTPIIKGLGMGAVSIKDVDTGMTSFAGYTTKHMTFHVYVESSTFSGEFSLDRENARLLVNKLQRFLVIKKRKKVTKEALKGKIRRSLKTK